VIQARREGDRKIVSVVIQEEVIIVLKNFGHFIQLNIHSPSQLLLRIINKNRSSLTRCLARSKNMVRVSFLIKSNKDIVKRDEDEDWSIEIEGFLGIVDILGV